MSTSEQKRMFSIRRDEGMETLPLPPDVKNQTVKSHGRLSFRHYSKIDFNDREARIERLKSAGIPDPETVVDSDPPPLPANLAPIIIQESSDEEVEEEPTR